MTHCYNCGHAGTFVLLVQFALAVPGPDARVPRDGPDHDGCGSPYRGDAIRDSSERRNASRGSADRADSARGRWPRCGDVPRRRDGSRHGNDSRRDASPRRGNGSRRDWYDRDGRLEPGDLPTGGDLSFAVQCPACDSTDVGVAATDLLARYGSNTTS
jgi:hypothetical protein